jgi:hypothetical protein
MAYTPVNRILLGAVAPVVMYYAGLRLGSPLIGAATVFLWGVGVFAWHLYSAHEIDGFSGIGAAYVMAELVGLAGGDGTDRAQFLVPAPVLAGNQVTRYKPSTE